MDPELDFVEPVEVSRKVALVTPEVVGELDPGRVSSIAFDPGGTTGWSVFVVWSEAMHEKEERIFDNLAFWSAGEFTGPEGQQIDAMMELIEAWDDDAHLTSEDFILQQFSMARELLAPVRINARLEDRMYVAYGGRRTLMYQMPSLALRSVTDERMKAWGFWNPLRGQQHARDAVKHNITRLRRLKEQWLKEDSGQESV
jgi:hypothetical protein